MDVLLIRGGFPLISLLLLFPLAGAFVLLFIRSVSLARFWTLAVTCLVALLSLRVIAGFDRATDKFQMAEAHGWIPQLHINYIVGVDGISVLLVVLTACLMPLCVLASWKSVSERVVGFMACLLVMETAMIGVFVALDVVLFYVFWEFMVIPMYLLIAIWGGPRKVYASVKFFLYTLAGSALLLVAIIALYLKNGSFFIPDMMWENTSFTFQVLVFLAFFLAFAIKIPMFPFHTWLPAAHVEAPTAGSVIVASILLKTGIYGMLRFCLPMTPDATLFFAPWLLWLSIIAIIYGGFMALAQQDMTKLIAYLSVGHMGFVTLGTFILNTRGVEGAVLQMINHGVTTGALFLCIGMIHARTCSRELGAAAGVGRFMPWSATFLAFFSLSNLGFPGTNTFIGQFLILAGVFKANILLALAAIPGTVLVAATMLRLLQRVVWGGSNNPDHSPLADLNFREIGILCPLLLVVFWIGLGPQPCIDMMHTSVVSLLDELHRWQQHQVTMLP
ncbi:MAG: NADH-quinone oxidoreductase subunit M [Deltaproteobacteria bacterium]|nr:MAG: NADH-quinone oxidoreductase subunit M [Deltaproteobacteria bacterium]